MSSYPSSTCATQGSVKSPRTTAKDSSSSPRKSSESGQSTYSKASSSSETPTSFTSTSAEHSNDGTEDKASSSFSPLTLSTLNSLSIEYNSFPSHTTSEPFNHVQLDEYISTEASSETHATAMKAYLDAFDAVFYQE